MQFNIGVIITIVLILISTIFFLFTWFLTHQIRKIEQQNILAEQQLLEQQKLLTTQAKNIEIATETANKIIDSLSPNADAETKEKLRQSLLLTLFQLSGTKGLEAVLPNTSQPETKTNTEE